jgi:NAD(P)H-flavin reductase
MPAVSFRATVQQIDILSYNVRGFRFKLVEPSVMDFQAGQFVIVNVPKNLPAPRNGDTAARQAGGNVVKRAYSIASPPHEKNMLEFCIQHVEGGIASTYFWQLKEGDTVSLSGPHGRFLLKEPLDYEPVFMATGTGVAPLRAMIKHLIHVNFTKTIWLLFGCRYEHSLLYESEFRTLTNLRSNFRYIPTVSRPKEWHGEVGHVQQLFPKHIKDATNREIYLCGWLEIVKAICKDLEGMGVTKEKLHYEEWG